MPATITQRAPGDADSIDEFGILRAAADLPVLVHHNNVDPPLVLFSDGVARVVDPDTVEIAGRFIHSTRVERQASGNPDNEAHGNVHRVVRVFGRSGVFAQVRSQPRDSQP